MVKKSNSFKNILMLLVVLLLTGAQVGTEAALPGALPASNAGESPAVCCDYFGPKSVLIRG